MDKKKNTKNKVGKYTKLLIKHFGYDSFRPGQLKIIKNLEKGRDVVCIMATGYGKSLCYQYLPVLTNKPAVVISPLISLMEDQRLSLEKKGITSICYNSTIKSRNIARMDILSNEYQVIFITPERVVQSFEMLEQLNDVYGISVIAIDEAHCISSWGHSFRSAYRKLGTIKKTLPDVPIVALTATATITVRDDIQKELRLHKPLIHATTFDRPNLFIGVKEKRTYDEDLKAMFVKKVSSFSPWDDEGETKYEFNEDSTIIYCITRDKTEKVAQYLMGIGVKAEAYHGGMTDKKRNEIHHKFVNDELNCIVATISFGMGIDKPDVRRVIHYDSPKEMESYYQEIGRAGRDGKMSSCIVFFNRSDFATNKFLLKDIKNEAYRKRRMKMIQLMQKYLYSNDCRKKIILEHFGEKTSFKDGNCGMCDNCKSSNISNKVTHDFSDEIKLFLRTIRKLNGKFGINMYIDVIRGSSSKRIFNWIKSTDVYDKGGHKKKEWWKCLAQVMMNEDLIEEKQIRGGFGSTVVLSDKGREWLNNNTSHIIERLDLVVPKNMKVLTK